MYFLFHPVSTLNHLVARLITDQITFLISIFLFVIISLNYRRPFWQRLDKTVYEWAFYAKESMLKKLSGDFAIFGNAIFHILFSLILSGIFFIVRHKMSVVLSMLFVLILSWGLNRLMKLVFKRVRPDQQNSTVRKRLSYCYPSGHVMASIPIYFFSSIVFQNLMPFLPWYIFAFIVSFFVVMSRIYLNHHYFTDVLGGICMGIFCLNISVWFYFLVGLI